ncbi:MAG: FtsX-like permease family protein [Oscillospiraceae bacterium]|nr:FtsX-like permease family protein [Oscillospiraceae bacterium]
MRNSSLYPKLALQNIRNNRKFYLPYVLALLGDAAAIYIMSALVNDPGVRYMTPGRPNGYLYVEMFMSIGMVIAFIFSAVFVLYINGFLIKQRKKELGLYNILGMGKRHIAMVLVFETVYIAALGIGGGLLAGLLLHKLVSLMIHKVMGMPVPFGFSVSWSGMAQTALMFLLLLGVTLLCNLNKVRASKPIELLRGGSMGEREPKTRWLLTLLGIVTLGSGYYIALKAQSGVEAVMWYFVAVFLVIVGTYCLFTAVSIFVLKALRRNKKFYYQTGHFIGISGMLHRMKQNAVGLANICILCTMVMVMLSGTLSLYLGTAEILEQQYPGDFNIEVRYTLDLEEGETPFDPEAMRAVQTGFVESMGYQAKNVRTCGEVNFALGQFPDGSYTTDRFAENTTGGVASLSCITADGYTAMTGETLELHDGEIAAYGLEGDTLTIHWVVPEQGTDLGSSSYKIVHKLKENPYHSPMIMQMITIVVPDRETSETLWRLQADAYQSNSSSLIWSAYIDIARPDGTPVPAEELQTLSDAYQERSLEKSFFDGTGNWLICSQRLRSDGAEDAYGLAGGFLFLGIFLGFIFLMATVLMIYYKQISEGYEDKERFEIMQKVGLSRDEVRASIRSQVLMVFFLPIAVAAVHIVFDFNMVEKLLTLFYLHDTMLTMLCTAGTVLVFFAVYGAVYLLTARTYYKIVER